METSKMGDKKAELKGPNPDYRSKFHQSEGQAKRQGEVVSVNHPKTKQDSEAGKNNAHRAPYPEKVPGKVGGFDSKRQDGFESSHSGQMKNLERGTKMEFVKKF